MTKTEPYSVLLLWRDGKLVAAQRETKTVISDDSGQVVFERVDPAEDIPLDLGQEILGQANAGLLARIAELEAGYAAELEKVSQHLVTTYEAEIANLQARIAALTSPPSPATLAFRALPQEIQEQFQSSYDTAALLIDAGRPDLAIAHIEGLKIPKNLEPYRAGILDLLKS